MQAKKVLGKHMVPSAYLCMEFFLLDENECARNNSGCEHHCINQLPGFVCSCNPGFELNLDGKSCSGTSV